MRDNPAGLHHGAERRRVHPQDAVHAGEAGGLAHVARALLEERTDVPALEGGDGLLLGDAEGRMSPEREGG